MEREEYKSEFSRRLEADPELRARCEATALELRKSAQNIVNACRNSEYFTQEDYDIFRNQRIG
jgi:hypothetical protein